MSMSIMFRHMSGRWGRLGSSVDRGYRSANPGEHGRDAASADWMLRMASAESDVKQKAAIRTHRAP
jgi:hypothetical protein